MNIDTINEQLDLLENTKTNIKQVLINKGQDIDDNTPFSNYAEEINNLTDTSDADATANDIEEDKTAYVNGEKVTGNLTLLGGIAHNISIDGIEYVDDETADATLKFTTYLTDKSIFISNATICIDAYAEDVAQVIRINCKYDKER